MPPTSSTKSVPPFESKLPPEFIKDLDERGQYLYTSIDEMRQAQMWLIERTREHGDVLAEVKDQTTKTNGRLLVTEAKVAALEEDQGLRFARLGAKLTRSKLFWAGAVIFGFVVAPWLAANSDIAVGILKALFV